MKIAMPAYTKEGYHSQHPVTRNQKDNKIRSMSEEANGIKHTITRHGAPAKGYQPSSQKENCYPPEDNKIRGLPPHQMERFGVNEDSRGRGKMRNESDSGHQSPRMGKGEPKYRPVHHAGEK